MLECRPRGQVRGKWLWQAGCWHLPTCRKGPCGVPAALQDSAPLALPLRPRDRASAHWPVVSLGPGFPGASISHPQLGQRSERWDGGREGRASLRGSCCSLRTSGPRPGLPGWPPTPDSDHTPQEAPAVSGGAADGPPPPPHLCPPSCVPAVVLSLLRASELHSEASSLDTGSGRVGQIAERATGHGFSPRPTPEADPAPP